MEQMFYYIICNDELVSVSEIDYRTKTSILLSKCMKDL
jgi:hypothetical protein